MTATTDPSASAASSRMGSLASTRAFTPARFLGNAHAQTIFAALLRFTKGPAVTRERLELKDGDFIDIDLARPERPLPGEPWALVLHGLEGSSEAPYVRGMARELIARGIEACLLNYRGCSGEPNRLARGYHMGETGDVRDAVSHLARSREGRPFGIVGFSSGANLLMKLLGEDGESAPKELALAIGVAPPYELASTCAHLDRRSLYVYRERLLRTLRAKALEKIDRFPGIADPREVSRARTFAAFDEAFTARLHGFRDARDYWERCSGIRYASRVARDLLLVSADDDPFFPRGHVPEATLRESSRIELLLVPHGGHVGFVSGSPLRPRYWAEEVSAELLASRLTPGSREE